MNRLNIYRFLCLLIGVACAQWVCSQSTNKNFIYKFEPQVPIVDESQLHNPYIGAETSLRTIEYFDGFGYPLQQIKIGFTPSHQNLVQPFFFDYYNRSSIKYLPLP